MNERPFTVCNGCLSLQIELHVVGEMAEESTETLARSQLEMLYRLGILERCPEDDKIKISSRHDAFLAALPPPSLIPPSSAQLLRRSRDDDSNSSLISSSKSSEFYSECSSGEEPTYHVKPRRHRRICRTHESRALSSSGSSQQSSSTAIPRLASIQKHRKIRKWFKKWQQFVRYRHEKDRRQAIADRFLKQSAFTRWARFFNCQRYEDEKKRLLDSWKIAISIDRWVQWKQRRSHLRELLDEGRRSFIGKIRQQRVWRRWVQFVKRQVFARNILTEKRCCMHRQLVRMAWYALRIYVFRARQDHLVLRSCMHVLRDLQVIRQRRRLICDQHREKIKRKRKHSVLQHWKVIADISHRGRILAWRVQFEVSRGRYFLSWREATRMINHITQLQNNIASRMLAQHFYTWKTATKAIRFGDIARGRREKQQRAIYFKALRDQTRFQAHCKHVQMILHHRHLYIAVHHFRVWTEEIKSRKDKVYQLRKKWRKRVLRWAWVCGWQANHRKRLVVKNAVDHARLSLVARCFNGWKWFRSEWRTRCRMVERADALYDYLCCRRILARWRIYHGISRAYGQQQAQAERHYQRHLLQRGIVVLWGAVYRNTQNSLRSHQLRQNQRISLKRRYFRSWRGWAQSRLKLVERLRRLQCSLKFRKSICNPYRRTWNRWIFFTSICRKRRRCDQHFRLYVMRRALFNWNQYAKLETRLRAFDQGKTESKLEHCVNHWKYRSEQWKKLRVICELAEKVFERKLCTRVIQGWRSRSRQSSRLCRCFERVRKRHESKLKTTLFHVWKEQLRGRLGSSRLRYLQDRRRVHKCFITLYTHSKHRKKLTQKLVYFRQVYGIYSRTSIIFRTWLRWRRLSTQYRNARHLRHQVLLKQVRQCWCRWRTFHLGCYIFYRWRCAAVDISKSTNKLGTRLRCFRESRIRALRKRFLGKWKYLVQRNLGVQTQQSLLKHQLNRELEGMSWGTQQATLFRLKSWFRKWRIAQNKDNDCARHHFRVYLLHNAMLAWWKATVHSKQERVLFEAQHTITKLSYYHPQQEVYADRVRRKVGKRKQLRKTLSPKRNTSDRAEDMKQMRRMLDPTERLSYSRSFHEIGKVIPRHEYGDEMLPARTSISLQREEDSPAPKARNCPQEHTNKLNQEGRAIFTRSTERLLDLVPDEMTYGSSKTIVVGGNVPIENHRGLLKAISRSTKYSEIRQTDPSPSPELRPYQQNEPNVHECNDRAANSKVENLLPLFDSDEMGKAMGGVTTPQPVDECSPYQKQSAVSFTQQDSTNERHKDQDSVIPTPSEAPGDILLSDAGEIREIQPYLRHCNEQIAGSEKPVVESDLAWSSLVQNGADTVARHGRSTTKKSRRAVHAKRIKVVASSKSDTRPLDDILQLTKGFETTAQAEVPTNQKPNDSKSDHDVFQDIVAYYVNGMLIDAGTNTPVDGSGQANAARMRVCFRMTRDVKLFQNDFYIDELLQIYDAVFNERDTELVEERHQDRIILQNEQGRLELFLERLVENHPGYRKHVSSCRQNDSKFLSAKSWFVQHHLTPLQLLQKTARTRPQNHNAYWVWEPMPIAMDLALNKLLPVITKYIRVLGHFFLRQAVHGSSTADKPQDHRMGSDDFVKLMKQARVFPQLFHRRELENAVRMSSCSSPEKEELNFPEFIEVLVRCSISLRWGELDGEQQAIGADGDSTIVVIKFVMLIFAMEGQGSVLHRRNGDVNAILSFLGKQQQRKKAQKVFRFRKMLVDSKRHRRTARSREVPSVWSQVRLHFAPQGSPTKSQDTFAELTQSWDGGPPHHNCVFDAQTNQPFGLDDSSRQSFKPPLDTGSHLEPPSRFPQENSTHPDGDQSSIRTRRETDDFARNDNVNPAFSLKSSTTLTLVPLTECEQISINTLESEDSITSAQHETPRTAMIQPVNSDTDVACTKTTEAKNCLAEPMEKDDFLLNILTSIGDVELLLSHPKTKRTSSRRNKTNDRHASLTDSATIPMLRENQSSYSTNLFSHVMTLGDLAAESVSSDYFSTSIEGDMMRYEEIEQPEILVHDPLLNHLTDIDRFTESTGAR